MSRVCVHGDRDGDPVAVDLVLPSRITVAELLPAIVELVGGGGGADGAARSWRLRRVTGAELDESTSLQDNDVRDGELLVLDRGAVPTPGPLRYAATRQVADLRPVGGLLDGWLPDAVAVVATTSAAAALASSAGSEYAVVHAVGAAFAAAAAALLTVVTGYPSAACLGTVALAAAAGFLAVPSAPAAPNAFLAAAVASSVSLVLLRLSGRPSTAVVAVAALSTVVALVTVVALPVAVVGAALATSGVALVSLAPRLSMLAAGLGPERGHGDLTVSAATGHVTLSGLVAGATAAVTAGAVVVTTSEHVGAAAFAGLVGLVLLLRSRSHVDADRRVFLIVGGVVALGAGLWALVGTRPESLGPVACAVAVAGLATARRPRPGPAVARLLDRVEYCALAGVVPAACWVGGAFTAIDGLLR